MGKAVFYREWLPLPKPEFNILAMLAEQGGSFSGNYSDICRYFGATPQSHTRRRIQAAIQSLESAGFIMHESKGRTHTLTVIPEATEIVLSRRWVQSVIHHDYTSEDVAFAQVLKLFVWIVLNRNQIVTNNLIAAELNTSTSTVISAKKVLKNEYHNIRQKNIYEHLADDVFRSLGQELEANAWWTAI